MSIKNFILSTAKDVTKMFIKDKLNNITSSKSNNEENTIEQEQEPVEEDIYKVDYPVPAELLNTYDFNNLPKVDITNPEGKKTFLMVDDIPYTKLLFQQDFRTIETLYNKSIVDDFKIVECFGNKAGWQAYKYAILDGNPVDYAMFDITLGHVLKHKDDVLDIDGIDIAYNIVNKYPELKFLLFTAHSLNRESVIINKYITKFENGLGKNVEDNYLNKNSTRYDIIYNLLYGDEKENGD